eukprot:scaffold627901_cov19-Prasinocladus_malaysianus.AAC.1
MHSRYVLQALTLSGRTFMHHQYRPSTVALLVPARLATTVQYSYERRCPPCTATSSDYEYSYVRFPSSTGSTVYSGLLLALVYIGLT